MAAKRKTSILWLFSGVMVLVFASAAGHTLSGVWTAVSALAGVGENFIAAIGLVLLLTGFALAMFFGLRDLISLARRNADALPMRWVVGSLLVMWVAAPFWNLCVVHVQEPISGSDLARTVFDYVHYGLVLTLFLPLGIGVPLLLARMRRQASVESAAELLDYGSNQLGKVTS